MDALAYLESHQEEILQRLVAFASIPSVSTDPAYKEGVTQASRWVADQLSAAGMQNVRINPTPGHPIVTADWLGAPGKPTIIVYGNYDACRLIRWRSGRARRSSRRCATIASTPAAFPTTRVRC
jgi:acetylornithine deacetylase/succinyl-diaminopimelate desuccinylase-like protein